MGAAERDEWLRAAWRAMVAGQVDAGRLVFVDEMGSNTSLSPLYAWARRGKRAAFASVARNWGANVTLLASITAQGMGPCLAVEGATTGEVFEAYLEHFLAPALRPGQIVVMDNLSAHKGGRVCELVEGRGCELLYLPPYFARLQPPYRASLLEAQGAPEEGSGACTRETLVEAMGRALDAVATSDAQGFFESCGYRATAQLL